MQSGARKNRAFAMPRNSQRRSGEKPVPSSRDQMALTLA
jgi:hypothetical protein